jgi:hypothetical protein
LRSAQRLFSTDGSGISTFDAQDLVAGQQGVSLLGDFGRGAGAQHPATD